MTPAFLKVCASYAASGLSSHQNNLAVFITFLLKEAATRAKLCTMRRRTLQCPRNEHSSVMIFGGFCLFTASAVSAAISRRPELLRGPG